MRFPSAIAHCWISEIGNICHVMILSKPVCYQIKNDLINQKN